MLEADRFSALRLVSFFPDAAIRGRKVYLFDWEYDGGLWHEDKVPGVGFQFPEADRKRLGVLTLLHPFDDSSAPRSILLPDPEVMRCNAVKVLEALELPIRFGDGQSRVQLLAGGKMVKKHRVRESKATQLTFQFGKPAIYRMHAFFGYKEGLGHLEIARMDLVRANARYAAGRK